LILDEANGAKLMAANRERIMALPDSYLDASFTKLPDTPTDTLRTPQESEGSDAQ